MNHRSFRLAAVLAASSLVAGAASAGATSTADSVRIAGPDRYATAAGVAVTAFEGVNVAIVATGQGYADALAANYLAGALGSPILLTPRASMDPGLPDALTELGSDGVILVGGDGAVSDSVAAEIEGAGFEVTRIAGATRYATARALAERLPGEAVGRFEEFGPTAIIVNGDSFADALSAGPMSFAQGWPVLLTTADRLQGDAGAAIESLGITHAIIVGGTSAVSDGVVADLTTLGVSSQRISGTDRTITSQAVANFMFDSLGYGADDIILARGDTYPDALAAGPRGGQELMPLLLTPDPNNLGSAAAAFIQAHTDVLERIEVFGGTSAISTGVEDFAVAMARG